MSIGAISANWSEGYVTDTLYTDNVYREQSPVWINYVAGLQGCVPRPLDQPFSYLELGCGLGHSITVFAAAFPNGRFVGVDFNPAHIDFARRRAQALGLDNLSFVEASFQDLAADAAGQGIARSFGMFDFAALHGIYSWISADARVAVQHILFDRMQPGGLVYNSYNCQPGWSMEAPLQRLLKEFSATGTGDTLKRLRSALDRMKSLGAIKAGYFGATPQAVAALNALAQKPDRYLAHEFLNGDWNAFYGADVADEMAAAKLEFVGSATLMENHTDWLLTEEGQAQYSQQPDQRRAQLVQDFLISQKFRRDVFVRGHGRLAPAEIAAQRARQCLVASKSLDKISPTIKVRRGTITIDPARFKPLIEAVNGWAGTEGDFVAAITKASGSAGDISRLLALLTAAQHLTPAATVPPRPQELATITDGKVGRYTIPLKANIIELAMALAGRRSALMVSPVTGSTVACGLNGVLFLNEFQTAGGSIGDFAARVQAQMDARGLRPAKNGKSITDPAEIRNHLLEQLTQFASEDLSALVRMGVLRPA